MLPAWEIVERKDPATRHRASRTLTDRKTRGPGEKDHVGGISNVPSLRSSEAGGSICSGEELKAAANRPSQMATTARFAMYMFTYLLVARCLLRACVSIYTRSRGMESVSVHVCMRDSASVTETVCPYELPTVFRSCDGI